MFSQNSDNLGEIIRRQRVALPLTQQELASMSGVSPSYLGRIERGDRYPSAGVLRRIAKPLGFGEDELFTLAGYLSPHPSSVAEAGEGYSRSGVDPYVAGMLAREPVDVQRATVAILTILKNVARGVNGNL
jgi:transcriptional regulator with XRE-family HTH domain